MAINRAVGNLGLNCNSPNRDGFLATVAHQRDGHVENAPSREFLLQHTPRHCGLGEPDIRVHVIHTDMKLTQTATGLFVPRAANRCFRSPTKASTMARQVRIRQRKRHRPNADLPLAEFAATQHSKDHWRLGETGR